MHDFTEPDPSAVDRRHPGPARQGRVRGRPQPRHLALPRRSPCSGRCSSKARPASARPRSRKVVAQALGRELIRLQCYEGLDIAQAAYEWNYSRQMIEIRLRAKRAGREGQEEARPRRTSSPRVPDPAAAAARAQLEGDCAGAADRRARPHRRAVRGLPAGSAVRLADHHPRDRHAEGRRAADRGHHLQPHARDPRRGQAPLLLPLGRLSRREARARDPAAQGAEGGRGAVARGGGVRAAAAQDATCSSCRAWPRPSTGPTAWWRSTASRSIRRPSTTRSACCSSTATTSSASAGDEAGRLVGEAKAAAAALSTDMFLRRLSAARTASTATDLFNAVRRVDRRERRVREHRARARGARSPTRRLDERRPRAVLRRAGARLFALPRGSRRQRGGVPAPILRPPTSSGCSGGGRAARARSCSAGSTWRPAAPRRWSRCAGSC